MKGYAQTTVFTELEQQNFRIATRLVELVPEERFPELRCHELVRAVGKVLGLSVQDGRYGFVEHSWLWLGEPHFIEGDGTVPRSALPNILDIYVPGQLPMVQLVATSPHLPFPYSLPWKQDLVVRTGVVEELLAVFRAPYDRTVSAGSTP